MAARLEGVEVRALKAVAAHIPATFNQSSQLAFTKRMVGVSKTQDRKKEKRMLSMPSQNHVKEGTGLKSKQNADAWVG